MDLIIGQEVPLTLQLNDGATTKYPRAKVFDDAGTELTGSPVTLTHVASGLYKASSFVMPNKSFIIAQYLVYSDSGHTTLDTNYSLACDTFALESPSLFATTGSALAGIVTSGDLSGTVEDC